MKKMTMTVDIKDVYKSIRKPLSSRGVMVMKPKKGRGSYDRKSNKEIE